MKSFLDFAKEKENDELKRQIDHHEEMADEHEEKAEAALMMGDRDGHALHMAKSNHFRTQCENLKGVKEEVEQVEEGAMPSSVIKVKEKIRMASDGENKKRFAGKSKGELSQMARRHGYGDKNPYAKFHDGITEEVEQIDELDTGTLKRYTKKALSQTMSSAKKGDMETSDKRLAGMSKALDRIKTREPMDTSRSLKNITKNWHKEEVEQVEENHVAIAMGKELDDEGSMVMNQLDQIQRSISTMRDIVKDPKMQLPGWVQSKVTLAADYMETVAGYMSSKNEKVSEEVELDEATPAWQRKEGKSEAGGLNKKGIMSYRRANPGSKLSMAVTTKPSKLKPGSKAANRRKSFCARMSGMKKRLTSAKTAKDPNSRINKSLRKWNC